MKINPEHFPFILIIALVVFFILAVSLGFVPLH